MTTAVILGTRPEAIRLYYTINAIKPEWILWTGQNFSKNLSDDILYDERFGNTYKNIDRHTVNASGFAPEFSVMLCQTTTYLQERMPDKVLILGDTNSSLAAALAAKKLGITIYHMEAGNRCYNPASPEEVNRRMIDSISDVHLCYTGFAKQNLLSEGVPLNRIHVIGNPMAEFPEMHVPARFKVHVLVDIHRAENQKYVQKLASILDSLSEKTKVKLVLHPRFYKLFENAEPSVPFSKFVELERNASLIITDSGTVCEEAAMLGKPCIVWRETMERPEILELGNTVLRSPRAEVHETIEVCKDLINTPPTMDRYIPTEYEFKTVSQNVKRILQGTPNYI